MKSCILYFLVIFAEAAIFAQSESVDPPLFNSSYWNGVADKKKLAGADREEFIQAHKRSAGLEPQPPRQAHAHEHTGQFNNFHTHSKGHVNSLFAGPCTNIDFENGNLTGWNRSSGFHPGYNATGCCPNANGQQVIMTGGGVDPYGGFPVVYPGGTASVRLGNNGVNGQADRLEQTFFVTANNANFTYRYAVVLNDAGHNVAQQPYFEIMILDSLGVPVNCTQYTVAAGANIPGYITSSLTANNSPVRFKPWTNVAMDLTPLIGQNVTLRFTTYDCSLGGHFGYAYVDGLCTSFATSVADTTCNGTPKQMCAPIGFATYSWNGPGVVNNVNRCISPALPGTYTCQTILVPGCPGPSFIHTLTTLPTPALSFTPAAPGNCGQTYTFNSVATITAGTIASRMWFFGDNTTSNATNPVHTYSTAGTFTVKLRVTANTGCQDSVVRTITINPLPNISFSPPSNCVNTAVQFTNTTNISSGSIVSYSWNFGNNVTSTLTQPSTTYSANGTYSVTLSATSNMGCTATRTNSLGIFPPPILSFSAATLCDVNGTTFSPSTSTAIASGSLVGFSWNFGDGNTSNIQNPVHMYANPGSYTVTFTGTSNHACVTTVTNSFIISPSPNVAFSTFSINACTSTFTFNNTSTISAGIISYSWNIGGATSTVSSPTHTFPSIGTYTVRLSGTSDLGCVDVAQQVITIHPYPVINFQVPSPCENAVFTVSTSAVSGSVTSYNWNFGDPGSGPSNTSTAQNPTHVYNSVGSYTVTLNLMSNLNCPSSSVSIINVNPNPAAIFSTQPPPPCETTFTFANTSTVTSINSTSIAGQIWNFGSGSLTGSPTHTYTFAGPGTYTVSMIAVTSKNCMDTAYSVITVHPKPVVSFTAVPPSCAGSTVAFNSFSSISSVPDPTASIVSHTWSYGDNTFSNLSLPPPHSYAAANLYTVSYAATSNKGCVSSVQQTLQIYSNPTVAISATNLCLGDVTQFSSNSGVTGGSIVDHSWNFGNGASASSINSVGYTYPSSGNYMVSYTATSNQGCTGSTTLALTVNPLPTVNIGAMNICADAPLTFTNNSTIPAPYTLSSYTWNFGDGSTPVNPVNPVHTYTLPGTYTVSLSALSSSGCANSNTALVTVYTPPFVSYSAAAACMNSPVTFSNSSGIQAGSITSYSWTFGDGNTSAVQHPVHSYTNYGIYTPTLIATSNSGCARQYTASLAIHPQVLSPDFTVSGTCHNDNTQFTNLTASLVPPSGTVTGFSWDFGDGGSANTSTALHTYANSGAYNVTFSATTNHNCVSTISKTVIVFPLPVAIIAAPPACLTQSTSFTSTISIAPSPPNSIASVNWYFGDGTSVSSGPQNISHTYSTQGSYNVSMQVLSNHGCAATVQAQAIVHPLPVVNFGPPSACVNSQLQFTNTSGVFPGTIVSYTWNFGNGVTSSQLNPLYSYTVPSTYSVSLRAVTNQGCESQLSRTLAIYPAPEVTVTPVQNGCINDAVTFNSNISIPSTGINSYTWNFGDSTPLTTIQASTITPFTAHTYTAYNTYTVNLTVRSTENCITSAQSTVTVYPKPMPGFTATFFCRGDNTSFVNTSSIPNGTISAFMWNFNDGAATSTSVHPQHVFTSDSTYHVILTATSNPEGGLACIASVSKSITINPLPVASFSANVACIGKPTLFANTSPTANVSGWSWDFDSDGLSNSSFESPFYIFAAAGTYTTALTVKNNFSCVRTATAAVTVMASPSVTLSSSRTCFGEPTFFSFSTPGTNNSYTWNVGGGIKFVDVTPPYSFATSGTHTVLLSLKDNVTTCESNVTTTVVVDEVPVISFTANPVCLDNTTQILNHSNIANGNIIKYRWDYDGLGWDDSSSTGAITPYKYPAGGNHIFKLWAISDNGCRAEKSGVIRVYDKPKADFLPQKICAGDKVTFASLSSATDGSISSYFWDYNNDNLIDGQGMETNHTYTQHGEHTAKLSVVSQFGCSSSVIRPVEVHPKPVAVYNADKTSGCPPLCVNFTNLSHIARGSFTSSWNFGDLTPVQAVKDPGHCFVSGSYNLTLRLVSDQNCVTELRHPNYITVHNLPVAAFNVEPPEVDEDEPYIAVKSEATDAAFTRYYINDGTNYGSPAFSHTLRNLEAKIKPMVVQVVTSEYGCTDTTFKVLEIKPAFTIYVPNVFTPNGDGLNDDFGAKGVGILKFALQIYDRWGHLVFTSTDIRTTWDGMAKNSQELIKQDVYTWKAQVTDLFHRNHHLIGKVTVLK